MPQMTSNVRRRAEAMRKSYEDAILEVSEETYESFSKVFANELAACMAMGKRECEFSPMAIYPIFSTDHQRHIDPKYTSEMVIGMFERYDGIKCDRTIIPRKNNLTKAGLVKLQCRMTFSDSE